MRKRAFTNSQGWLLACALTCASLASPAVADTLTYTYDARGRLTGVAYPNGRTVTYEYDAAGNRTRKLVADVDLVPDARDWTDLFPYSSNYNGTSSTPNWVDGPTLTIAGLSPGATITLSFGQEDLGGGAGLLVAVYKNGTMVTRSLSLPDGNNQSGGTVGTVTVTNGDTIRFRASVFDTSVTPLSGSSSGRDARQLIYNQTTGTLFDTFMLSGFFEEKAAGCDPLEFC